MLREEGINEKAEAIGGVTHTLDYTYDTAGQITNVAMDGATVAVYTYDADGNRLTAQSPAVGVKTCVYDEQDRLTSCNNGETYTYTANGELLTKTLSGQTTSYQYDVLGNLPTSPLFLGQC
jgi:YD repeat-containing protein